MLNINQNFDLKAPVFNFDRDYFNSVEELKAYDTSNVPNHFVTNVAGTLYQFTDGNWLPMISTEGDDTNYYINLGCENAFLSINGNSYPFSLELYNENNSSATLTPTSLGLENNSGRVLIATNYTDSTAGILVNSNNDSRTVITDNYINCGDDNKNILLGTTQSKTFGLTMQDTASKSVQILVDKQYTDEEQDDYSSVDLSLTDDDNSANINARTGFIHKDGSNFTSIVNAHGLSVSTSLENANLYEESNFSVSSLNINRNNRNLIELTAYNEQTVIGLGSDKKFSISRLINNTEGATITGVKSITAFANPSATKVWATDGSTANMPTKFSDLKNDSIYITGNKGETDAKFKIYYKQDDVVRSKLIYAPRHTGVGISELALVSYDTSGHNLSQLRIRPDDNRDNGQYLIQVQNVIGDTINYVSTLATENVSLQNFKNNTSVDLKSDELDFYNDPQGEQIQLKVNKEGITKTNGKPTEVFATDGSTVDLSTYTNYFNGTTTADKLKAKAVEVTDNTNSVAVSPTGITATNGSATKVFATDGSIANLNDYAKLGGANFVGYVRLAGGFDCAKLGTYGNKYLLSAIQADQSPTKVYTTDGNLADLSTKANSSDVLLKKSTDGGYYMEKTNSKVGAFAFSANVNCKASGKYSTAKGYYTNASGNSSHAEGHSTNASGSSSHAEGFNTRAQADSAHAEGQCTIASGDGAHAQGLYNIDNKNAIHSTGIGNSTIRKNAEYIYAKTDENTASLVDNPKNGYKYLIGVGGYDGISTDNSTYKSVQEVIADLTARIEQLEKLQNQKIL